MHFSPASIEIGGVVFEWGRRTFVIGIVNATTDSFSGDGVLDAARAADQAARMVEGGAALLDVGAESTRPDFPSIDADEEWRRLEPVLRAVRAAVNVPVTVDTSKAAVAERAFEAGADALNDVRGLLGDSALAPLIARLGKPAVLMHNQRGRDFGGDVILDVCAGLEESMQVAERAGLDRARLILDPGFGFGWTPAQNLEMLRRLEELRVLGRPLLLGTSRKSTLGLVLDRPVEEREWGTAATVALAVRSGVDIVRVHDVPAMADVARMADAIVRGWTPHEGT
ncbi:MAG: dihydropteroate synthase [Dehalococcoidia bacterium]|nr:dihydropteroate synthase [Dehalococcoidia bacterium]